MDNIFEYNGLNCICLASGTNNENLPGKWHYRVRDAYGLYYVTKGKGKICVDGKEYIVSAGQSFLAFPFSNFMIAADKDEPWIYKWVEFKGAEAELLVSQTGFGKKSPIANKMPIDNLSSYFDMFSQDNNSLFKQCREVAKLFVLFSFYIEFFPRKTPENKSYTVIAREYIEENFQNVNCNVRKVADHVKIDRTYLFRLFKDETGISVIDYIRKCRIDTATKLLQNDQISIKDVAYSVGFSDQMYFSKVFKQVKGMSPTEFRRERYANVINI